MYICIESVHLQATRLGNDWDPPTAIDLAYKFTLEIRR